MYHNYGDRNFFELGTLVDSDHSDTVFDLLLCKPYSDEEDSFQFAHVQVDLEDSWVNWDMVDAICGTDPETDDPVLAAIAATECYDWDNFGASSFNPYHDWRHMTRKDILEELKGYLIAWDEVRAEAED